MLAAVELANHGSPAWLRTAPTTSMPLTLGSSAGDDQPVAAVDALALLAGQLVGHLQRRFATGAFNLHGNETPGLARER